MKVWILRPLGFDWEQPDNFEEGDWDPWYDKSFGFVVGAESETEARSMASAQHGDEGADVWLDPASTACDELTTNRRPGVIIRDFKAA